MNLKWQDIRVFISSTFRDMHAERDHLIKRVFPDLRERLEKHRIHLIDIDLRWGVTQEQADNDRVLDLCLQQIDECRPFFIGILGERYGWVPEKLLSPDNPQYGWIQSATGKSITELEIIHGVIRDPAVHSRVLREVLEFAREQEFQLRGLLRSPVLGPKGNIEFLVWLELKE